jgi:hypothetical protein
VSYLLAGLLKNGSQLLDLRLTAGLTGSSAAVTANDGNGLSVANQSHNLFDGFLLSNNHVQLLLYVPKRVIKEYMCDGKAILYHDTL